MENDLWGFGEFTDVEDGLWASMRVLDGAPNETYRDKENGDQIGVSPSSPPLIITYCVGKNLWVSCKVENLRHGCDAHVEEDMVWKVNPGDGDPSDAYPEKMGDDERLLSVYN